jgi:serine/threonine protein kinase
MDNLKIKNYTIDNSRIGRGAFSIVYKGYNKNNKIVAIKKIFLDKKKHIEIFIKEFKILRKLNHKNIIKVHDVIIEDKNTVYLVLDYFQKGDLSKFLNNRALKEKFAQNYTIQLKDGMEYLYKQKIIHRDLKPQNILVSDNNLLKICDFGFARYFENDIMLGTICGSPLYMAPEIMNKKKYNSKVDLWSLGIIIYEMLYGYVPFTGSNVIDLMKNIEKNNLEFDSNFNISNNCKLLISSLLKIDPKERIEWNNFFSNDWLNQNLIEIDENKLLEIAINGNIPNLNNFNNNENKFIDSYISSYKYKSICEDIDQSIEFNFELNKDSTSSSNLSEEFKSFEDELLFIEEDKCNLLENDNSIETTFFIKKSKPINIKQNNYLNESYVFVSPNVKNYSKSKSLTDSIKEYLDSSLTLVKQGIEYISKSDSL